jgi:crotonobetainyl-CoA:carnitine CoA-transferase CaiB-like acyl-CoA transferase
MPVLDGYRVLDLSIAMAGPLASMRLGDLGADVIKVEPPSGEWQRHTSAGGAQGHEVNASFLSLNRNKRSLAIDLKSARGQQVLHRLVAQADVVLQNYRPGVAERLGADYDTISGIKPDIVYVSVSGYGETGPYAQRPGQDILLQAMGGALYSSGQQDQPPQPAPYFLVDAVTAYSAFEGVLAALLHRERTGQGQLVQVNMLDALIAMQMQELSVRTVGGVPQQRGQQIHAHCYIRAPYGVFPTADGYLALAFPDLGALAGALDAAELGQWDAERDGFAQRDAISAIVTQRLKTEPTSHWLTVFGQRGIWAGPVYSYDDLLADPQVQHNGSFVSYDHPTEGRVTTPGFAFSMSATPAAVTRPAPTAGQHTREVLADAGLPASEVDELLADGVIGAR